MAKEEKARHAKRIQCLFRSMLFMIGRLRTHAQKGKGCKRSRNINIGCWPTIIVVIYEGRGRERERVNGSMTNRRCAL
jgi:hypothetical protein